VDGKYGDILYRSKLSLVGKLLLIGIPTMSGLVLFACYNLYTAFVGQTHDIISNSFYLICVSFFLSLFLILFISYQRFRIYENGVFPTFRTFKAAIRRIPYLIPFNEIQEIGVSKLGFVFWFIMKDGTIAECDTDSDFESARILLAVLKRKFPEMRFLVVTRNKKYAGIPLERFSSTKNGIKRQLYFPRG